MALMVLVLFGWMARAARARIVLELFQLPGIQIRDCARRAGVRPVGNGEGTAVSLQQEERLACDNRSC